VSRISTYFAAFALALLAPTLATAQSSDPKGANMRALGERNPAPAAKSGDRSSGMKPCPEYGAGFYRLNGSDTCARIGGAIGVDVGTSSGRR